ncbi:MAG: PD40 domain-containing protein [Ardenticatenaceae bacterium]|nr:PD40 domain-containing protein [Ardenticatenaceae bacterium]
MKRVLSLPLCLILSLWLTACNPATPPQTTAPTPTPTAQLALATSTETITPIPLPTETIVVTSTPIFSTNTPNPTETTTTILTPVPTVTNTPQPTFTPLRIEGVIFLFWDTETPLVGDAPYSIPAHEPKLDLYIAVPGDSLDNWQTSSLLRNQLNWSDETLGGTTALSPDQSMIAFTIHKKIDSNTDVVSIYVVNLLEGTVKQLTEEYFPRIYNISWLPDNQTVAYSLKQQGFLVHPDDAFSEQFTPTFPTDISKLRVSPDGQFAAIILQYSELLFINIQTRELLPTPIDSVTSPINTIWSPDSKWFVLNQVSGGGLLVFNVETEELVSLVETDQFGLPSWSPDGSQLAFVTGTRENTDLYIWDSANQVSSFIMNLGNYLKAPVWSSQGNFLATGSMENDVAKFIVVDISTGKIQPLTQIENVYDFDILSWSPDEQWLLVFLVQEDKSCLYVINYENGTTYCAVETTGTINPSNVFWLSP